MQELVRHLKYNVDLDSMLQAISYSCVKSWEPFDLDLELKLIIALAVSDQKEGKPPASCNSVYQAAYHLSTLS